MKKEEGLEFELNFFERLSRSNPNFVDALIPLAELYTRRKEYHKGLEVDQRIFKLKPDDPIVSYNLACSFALTGNERMALEALRRAIKLGYRDFRYMARDPDLKSVQKDPKFKAMVSKGQAKKGKDVL